MTKEEKLKNISYLLIEYEDGLPILIDLATRMVVNWPKSATHDVDLCVKVCDAGIYTLLDKDYNPIVIYEGYVPNIIPNDWGDYICLHIDSDGEVINLHEDDFSEWLTKGYFVNG